MMLTIEIKDRLGNGVIFGNLSLLSLELRELVAEMIPGIEVEKVEVEYRDESLGRERRNMEYPPHMVKGERVPALKQSMNLTPLVVNIKFPSGDDLIPRDLKLFEKIAKAVAVHLEVTDHLSDEVDKIRASMCPVPDGVFKQLSH